MERSRPLAMVVTITQARAPFTRRAYVLKCCLFMHWCSSHQEDPWKCLISSVLTFQQERLEKEVLALALLCAIHALRIYLDSTQSFRSSLPALEASCGLDDT